MFVRFSYQKRKGRRSSALMYGKELDFFESLNVGNKDGSTANGNFNRIRGVAAGHTKGSARRNHLSTFLALGGNDLDRSVNFLVIGTDHKSGIAGQ